MIDAEQFLLARREDARDRLGRLRDAVERADLLGISIRDKLPELCIYVTGSYGRLEASNESDVDLFFVHTGTEKKNEVSRVDKALLDAEIIRIAHVQGFPPFSKGGKYLNVHYLEDLLAEMGGPEDDWHNHFTARMLLLLESRPLVNEVKYNNAIKEIIGSYCRDYGVNPKYRTPMFLINDILRYWRTMCINYEHRRNERTEELSNDDHLKNLKLKFSRMHICFSLLLSLILEREVVSPDVLFRIVGLSPMERLDEAIGKVPGGGELVSKVKENYVWFLEKTGEKEDDVLQWISNSDNRKDAFDNASKFGKDLYGLLSAAGERNKDIMRYLVL